MKNAEFNLNPIADALGHDAQTAIGKWKGGELNVAFISDVHVGHPKVPTCNIIDGLFAAFPDNHETAKLDAIFIAGDFFDRNLNLSFDGITDIHVFIRHLLRVCEKHNIVLRVLEGTPSHDWKQGCLFEQVASLIETTADIRWVKELSIEYINSLGINVLYVPDEWEHDPDETWRQVRGLLHDHGLEKVDFSIMHGFFEFQVPKNVTFVHHDSTRYLDITNYFISIGHHHTQRSYKRILVQGSFDRLCHGEEGTKGHYRITVRENDCHDIRFVENELATKFVSIDCIDMDIEDALAKIAAIADGLRDRSHVRIFARTNSTLAASKRDLELRWDTLHWQIDREAEEKVRESGLKLVREFRRVDITSDSVRRLLEAKLEGKNPEAVKRALELLNEVS